MIISRGHGKQEIGPLQLAIHVVQNRRAGEQKSHWDKTNKESYHFKLCMSFVCLVPVQLLLSNVGVLYHVNGWLQRAYFKKSVEVMEREELKKVWTLIKHNIIVWTPTGWRFISWVCYQAWSRRWLYLYSNQVSDQGKVQCADHSVLLAPISLAGLSRTTGRTGGAGIFPWLLWAWSLAS